MQTDRKIGFRACRAWRQEWNPYLVPGCKEPHTFKGHPIQMIITPEFSPPHPLPHIPFCGQNIHITVSSCIFWSFSGDRKLTIPQQIVLAYFDYLRILSYTDLLKSFLLSSHNCLCFLWPGRQVQALLLLVCPSNIWI